MCLPEKKKPVAVSRVHNQGRQRAGIAPLLKRGAARAEEPFHKSIIGLSCYKRRLETHLLQVFANPENAEWFSIISVHIL